MVEAQLGDVRHQLVGSTGDVAFVDAVEMIALSSDADRAIELLSETSARVTVQQKRQA